MKNFTFILLSLLVISCSALAQQGDFCNFYIRSGFDSECIITNYKPGDDPEPLYDEHQCMVACRGSYVTYSIVGLPSGASYEWAVSGADSYSANTSNNTIMVNWSETAGIGTLVLSVYGQNDEFCEKQLCVDLIEKPIAGIISNPIETGYVYGTKYIDVCDGQVIQFYDNSTSTSDSPIVGYLWTVGTETASTQNYTFTADYNSYGSTVQIKHIIINECGCEDAVKYIVNISKFPTLEVDCFGTACENTSATYNAINPCTDYIWYVDGGHIQNGQGTSSLTVVWDNIDNGYGYIALNGSNCEEGECPYLTYLPIPVISDNAEIQGPDVVCVDDIVYFELPQWASTEYNWSITSPTGVTELFSGHRHKYLLQFDAIGTYTINCTYNCSFLECGGVAQSKTVVVTKPFTIISDREACVGEYVTFTTDFPLEMFDWTIYHNGTVIYTQTATDITYAFNTAGGYTIEASSPNFCNTAYSSININGLPPTPNPYPEVLSWTNRVCLNSGYVYNATPSSPEYYLHWSTTCGQPSQFDGNEYNVVIGNNLCSIDLYNIDRNTGCMSQAYQYQLTQFVPQTINWSTYNECANEEFTMSVTPEDGVLLEWDMITTTLASIVSDRFASTITIQTNGTPGTFYMLLKRTFCDTYIYDTIPVTIKPYIIPEISMPKNICQYATATISAGNTEQILGTWTLEIEGHTYTYTGLPSGATWNYTFNNSGTIPVSLSFSADGCTQTYETIETVNVIVAPQFSLSFHEIIQDTLYELNATVLEPNAIGYSYNWSDGHHTQQFQHNGAYFSYSCTVIDNSTGCSNSKTVSRPQPEGCRVDEGAVSMSGGCSNYTFVNPSSGGNISWRFVQNASTPQFSTSGTNNNTCNATFTDAGYYRVYSWYVDNGCSHMRELEFCIPLIARMSIEYSCPTGPNIYLTLTNTSDFMLGTTINSETWYVDGILVSNPSNCAVTSGTHTITLTVNYSGSIGSGSCTTSQTVTYNRGTAAFTVSPGPYCSDIGIQFTDNSTNAVSWCWTFNDSNPLGTNFSQNPEQSFENNNSSGLYVSVTLSTEDNIGCYSSTSTTLMINPNTLRGSISADPVAVCYGNPWTINFNHDGTPTANPVYHWHETNQTTTVNNNDFYETGSYYVRVTNNNGCVEQSDWENICFKSVPIAEISGDADYCPDGTITLIGESGNNTYQWAGIGSMPLTTPNISASIASYGLLPGNYTITLTVSKDGCSSTDTKAITIHSAPATPLIGFGANSCLHIPPVDLISTASQNLNWSTGHSGTSTSTYNAGIHTAYYTDPTTGCRSANAEIDVPKPPDFNELMTGCFEFCEKDLPRYVLGPIGVFANWKWLFYNSIINAGTDAITPTSLQVQNFGTYSLYVKYTSSCSTTSDKLVVSQKEICDSCDIEISLLKDPWCKIDGCKIIISFYLNIYNPSANPATLEGISSPNMGTLNIPTLPVTINPGTTTPVLFGIELDNYEPQDMYLQMLFHDGNGNPCYSRFFVDLSDALDDCVTDECEVSVDNIKYLVGISSSGMAYFEYTFITSSGMGDVQLFSNDVAIVDVNYNATTGEISGILSITPLELQQLIDSSGNICFRLYACHNDVICKLDFCLPASMFIIIGSKMTAADDGEMESDVKYFAEESQAADFSLFPNPATSTVSISGDNFNRATVIDTGGRVVMEVYDTTFNIGSLRDGEYIVKVISLDGAIQYLKLVKR